MGKKKDNKSIKKEIKSTNETKKQTQEKHKILLRLDRDLKENFKKTIEKKGIYNFSQGVRLALSEYIQKEK